MVLSALMVFCIFPMETFAVQNDKDVIILYENDVHYGNYEIDIANKKDIRM